MNRGGFKAASRECIRDAKYSTKKVTLVFLLLVAGLIGLDLGVTALMERVGTSDGNYLSQTVASESRNFIITYLVSLVCQLLLVIFELGYTAFSLRLSRGEEFSLRTLLEGFDRWGKALLLYVMMNLYIALWSMLFVMPASYVIAGLYLAGTLSENVILAMVSVLSVVLTFVISYRYRMAWFVLLDYPELSVGQILKHTQTLNRKRRMKLFLMDLSFLPWIFLCVLTCGILLIWKLPYISASYAHAYNAMLEDFARRQKQMEAMPEDQSKRFDPQ